jgi:hypothetical protein
MRPGYVFYNGPLVAKGTARIVRLRQGRTGRGKVIFETRMFLNREGDFDTTKRIVQSAADRWGVTIVGSDRDA